MLELRDEFAFVRNDANYADVAKGLQANSVKVVLVRGKRNKGIAGAISETHFLRVCKSGIDPARTQARDKMQTDLLRLRDDTPLADAVQIIEERDPDAILILKPGNKFAGYLSPEDFREIQIAHERLGGKKGSGPSSPPPVKADVSHSLDLGDEFSFVRNDAMFGDAAKALAPSHVKVILVRAKKGKGIAGILTEPEFLKVCATGINPNNTLVRKHMLTDILRIRSDTPLEDAAKIIGEKDPDAVLVLSDLNRFVGYLSPADYNEALELLKKKKAEVFDVPSIKPEIMTRKITTRAIRRMRSPPRIVSIAGDIEPEIALPLPELERHESEADLGINTILREIRRGLGKGQDGPVIWSEDGSEILVHNEFKRDVLRPVPKTIEGGPGRELPLPNCDAMMAIATRGSESHGVHLLQIDGARIESQSEMIHDGDRTISLWPLRSVEEAEGSLRSYLEIVADASSDGALVMLMDAKSAKQRLGQQTWDQLVAAADEYIGVEQG
jgi:CBS domain-containing protein